jgi:hypothetical protein
MANERLEAKSGAPAYCAGGIMAQVEQCNSVSAFECDVIREAFKKSVIEESVPADQWRNHAARLIRAFTSVEDIDPAMLDWIARK